MNEMIMLERDLEDPRDKQAERERKMREREAWEYERADQDYAERAADEYYKAKAEMRDL